MKSEGKRAADFKRNVLQGDNLGVPVFFRTIEETGLSTWLRTTDSLFGFYFVLLFHTLGLSLLVGANALVDLRILGIAPDIPLKPLKRFFAVMWTGLGMNIVTGLLLVTAYPTKALTNPVFYFKLILITLGVITMRMVYVRVFEDATLSEATMMMRGKLMAKWSLAFWIAVIVAGRLLPETSRYMTYGHAGSG